MGRPPTKVDTELLLDLVASGLNRKDVAAALGVTPPTVDAKIEELKRAESPLVAYEKVMHLDLIAVQQRCLSGVTTEKIAEAPLGQIATMFSAANKAMHLSQGRPTEIHGLMGYLLQLEKEDLERKQNTLSNGDDAVDITPEGECADG